MSFTYHSCFPLVLCIVAPRWPSLCLVLRSTTLEQPPRNFVLNDRLVTSCPRPSQIPHEMLPKVLSPWILGWDQHEELLIRSIAVDCFQLLLSPFPWIQFLE